MGTSYHIAFCTEDVWYGMVVYHLEIAGSYLLDTDVKNVCEHVPGPV